MRIKKSIKKKEEEGMKREREKNNFPFRRIRFYYSKAHFWVIIKTHQAYNMCEYSELLSADITVYFLLAIIRLRQFS